jgi:hypothetical protein
MAKGKKKRKPKIESEKEDDEAEEVRKTLPKLRGSLKEFKNKSCNLNNKKSISLARLKSSML